MASTSRDSHILTISVRSGTNPLVPSTFIRLEHAWMISHTCFELLQRVLREHDHANLVDRLGECEVTLRCSRAIGVMNSLGNKRARAVEEVVATTFLADNLADTLQLINSDELSYIVVQPPPARPTAMVDGTVLLMRAAVARNHRPPSKSLSRMRGDHIVYNSILSYLEGQGVGWTTCHLASGKEWLEHIASAFWSLTPKVRQ